jgi:CHASE2 domain-containing sensor protein
MPLFNTLSILGLQNSIIVFLMAHRRSSRVKRTYLVAAIILGIVIVSILLFMTMHFYRVTKTSLIVLSFPTDTT